jgi:hypothetical protein
MSISINKFHAFIFKKIIRYLLVCDLKFCDIQYNYETEATRYGINILNHGHC